MKWVEKAPMVRWGQKPNKRIALKALAILAAYLFGLGLGWYIYSPRECTTDSECAITPPCVMTPTCDGGPINQPADWFK